MQNVPDYLKSSESLGLADQEAMHAAGIQDTYRVRPNGEFLTLLSPSGAPIDDNIYKYLDIIVVGVHPMVSRSYYKAAYDPSMDKVKPDCYSLDSIAPAENAADPQSHSCAECPMSQFVKEADKIKAPICKQRKRLAVLIRPQNSKVFLPHVFAMSFPGGSFKNWKKVVKDVVSANIGNRSRDLSDVVLRLSIVNRSMVFEIIDYVPEDIFNAMKDIANSVDVKSICSPHKEAPVQITHQTSEPKQIEYIAPPASENEDREQPKERRTIDLRKSFAV